MLKFKLHIFLIITSNKSCFLTLENNINHYNKIFKVLLIVILAIQVKTVNNKINKAFYAISRIKNSMLTSALINFNNDLVYGHLSYNIII